jgi:hypothetical protein
MTLVETMVGLGIGSIAIAAVMVLGFFSARSFAALANYVDLDSKSRKALDTMTKDIREVDSLQNYLTNQLTFQGTTTNGAAYTLTYTYDSAGKTLTRTKGGQPATTLLDGCTYMAFDIFQRCPSNGIYGNFPTADPSQPGYTGKCKLVQLTWVCSRSILGKTANTESVQSAKVVIRRK